MDWHGFLQDACGQCVKNCPMNNIVFENGKPIWGINVLAVWHITPMQDFYNPIPAFVVYVRRYFMLIFQMYYWI